MTRPVLIPGRTLSTGGRIEGLAGQLLDRAHDSDVEAARWRRYPAVHAAMAGHAQGLRTAAAVTLRLAAHEIDQVYVDRYKALPAEVHGRPAGNASGRAPAQSPPATPLPMEHHP